MFIWHSGALRVWTLFGVVDYEVVIFLFRNEIVKSVRFIAKKMYFIIFGLVFVMLSRLIYEKKAKI